MDALRLFGLGASLAGTLGQLGAIAATWPWPSECDRGLCGAIVEPGFVDPFGGWEPYIDNEGVGAWEPSEPRCPGPQSAGSRFRLDRAPLPAGFNAHAWPGVDILACVKLAADGSVEAVRIVAGTGRAPLDARLLRSIHRRWRFSAIEGAVGDRAWQRVRLNSSYGSGPAPPVGPLPL